MAGRRVPDEGSAPRPSPPTTPEDREQQLIALAYQDAERGLRDGTASAQVKSQFLKLGSTRERLEQEKLRKENELLKARVRDLESSSNLESLAKEAIAAFRRYSGDEVAAPGE